MLINLVELEAKNTILFVFNTSYINYHYLLHIWSFICPLDFISEYIKMNEMRKNGNIFGIFFRLFVSIFVFTQ